MVDTQKIMTLADTARLIAKVHKNAAGGQRLEYDATANEYTNIAAFWQIHADGKIYGARFPKWASSNSPEGTKTRDNSNLVIELSTNDTAGRDDYAALNAFRVFDCNATVDDDGIPHVNAIDGVDDRFKRDGSNGDVWVMACPGFYKVEETDTHVEVLYSDTQWDGYQPLPGVLLPDGSKRSCLLFAKYAADLDSNNKPISVSGHEIDREFGSQNRIIDYALLKGKGYAGRCQADNFYVHLMLLIKWATKNSDVLGGCFSHSSQTACTKAETNVKRVVVAKSAARAFDIGSTVNVGTDAERNNTGNYSAARSRTILSKTTVDDDNTALNLDGDAFATTTDCKVSTMPWKTGATDNILGTDGRPSSTADKMEQPIKLQGIELFNGIYEIDADTLGHAKKDSNNNGLVEIYRVFDITKASKNSTDGYIKVSDLAGRVDGEDNWQYSTDFIIKNGMFVPQGKGATSTTGLCDGVSANPLGSQGLCQVRRFGYHGNGLLGGAWALHIWDPLSYRWWNIGSRLSALGRTHA